ncbi:MAG: motility associated factor glycosyltransferase family protein [Phycisphaerae bacterium]|nr:motility associated factor glycosyltransferase family protein [Phycisphaerae bacterium]
MKVLWENNAKLAQQIELAEPEHIDLIPTRSGDYTCQRQGPLGELVFIHSKYDPIKEAGRWVEGAMQIAEGQRDEEDRMPMCFVVDGFGLGYHVKALLENLSSDAFVIVVEPDIAMIATALKVIDFSEYLENNIVFILKDQRQEILNKLERYNATMMMGVVFTRSLQKADSQFFSSVHKAIGDYASYTRSHLMSLVGNCVITCRNLLNNLPVYMGTKPINILLDRFMKKPAIVVSAGPSLSKNIDYIKEIRDKVVVIAVQTTLKPLLAKGIKPDFVTSLDYHEISKRFFQGMDSADLSDIHLVAEPKATWHVIDAYRGKGPISLLGNDFLKVVLEGADDEHGHLPAGATVAHLAFYLAEYMGCDPIILTGQDLGYSNNVYYSPGNALHEVWKPELNRFCTIEMKEWSRIARSRRMLRKVKDIYDNPIYTDEQMYTYLQQFEKDFAQCKAQVIDATEGGVKKECTVIMTLKEVAEQYCTENIDPKLLEYRKDIIEFDKSHHVKACDLLDKRIKDVNELLDISNETVKIVKEMLEIIEDQPALNKKMGRLDELRTMVKHRNSTYGLVRQVSQMAELFRFREDRTINANTKAGIERQRRQLRRDASYVSEIAIGCKTMLELLESAKQRIQDEI